jgi:hypothetical protein
MILRPVLAFAVDAAQVWFRRGGQAHARSDWRDHSLMLTITCPVRSLYKSAPSPTASISQGSYGHLTILVIRRGIDFSTYFARPIELPPSKRLPRCANDSAICEGAHELPHASRNSFDPTHGAIGRNKALLRLCGAHFAEETIHLCLQVAGPPGQLDNPSADITHCSCASLCGLFNGADLL